MSLWRAVSHVEGDTENPRVCWKAILGRVGHWRDCLEIVQNKALVLRTHNPQKYSVIPDSVSLGQLPNGVHEIIVRWGLDEVRVLRNLGVKDAPSPILGRYDWPGKFTPFAHQKDTSAFLTLNNRAFVFNEPGTGKTMSAIWAADYLMKLGRVRKVVILCPLSIMQSAWQKDIGASAIHRTAVVCHHVDSDRRVRMVQHGYDFTIVNYDGLPMVVKALQERDDVDLVIVDEANAYKNPQTKRWKVLNALLRPDTMVWMMTGTPAAQSPIDAFGLAKIINPNAVPRFQTAWRDLVLRQLTRFKWQPKPDAHEKVQRALQPAIRYTKKQCLDLPPVLTVTRDIELTPQQSKYYKIIKTQMLSHVAGETISAVNAAAVVNKLLQISAGAAYTDNHEVIEFDCEPRLNVLMEVLEETPNKTIVFAHYRHSIDTIATHLKKENVSHAVVHGDVNRTKRGEIFHAFQHSKDPQVLIIQEQAAAHGVTLTAADTVVFWGPVMSVEMYIQCIARTDRIGQVADHVTVVHIQGSEIERRMFKLLETRVAAHDMFVKLYESEQE